MKAFDPIKLPVLPPQQDTLQLTNISTELTQGLVVDTVLQNFETNSFELDQVTFEQIELSSARIKNTYMSNVVLEDCLFFGSHFNHARIIRTQIKRGIYSGVVLSGATIEDVVFTGCKLNMLNFRTATLKRVAFIDCDLAEADFGGARFDQVRFSGCKLDGAEFSDCQIVAADLRGSNLALVKGIGGLRRATISNLQLIELSHVMAAEFGLKVED
ncbi:MAG: pentapeptide repeat-containing protein [Candidatus Saccharibacteria bacterium]